MASLMTPATPTTMPSPSGGRPPPPFSPARARRRPARLTPRPPPPAPAPAPGDVLALIGLGDALEAKRDLETAARVYGSIIDLFPARADFRRFAGERLERLGKAQRALIIDTYRRSVEQRPDHLTGHRMLAYA